MHKKIYNQWNKVSKERFWGNFFDSRFFVAYIISKKKTDSILDVGCGAGILLNQSSSEFKVGLDLAFDSLQMAKSLNPNLQLICGDAVNLPFRNNSFSTILAVQVLVQLKLLGLNWPKAIEELNRVGKERCKIIISGNNRQSRHFQNASNEINMSYLTFKEQLEILKKYFNVKIDGYDPHSKLIMYPIKKILFNIPDKLEEYLLIHKILFRFLRSKKYLKNGRSYLIFCTKK